MLHHSCTLDQSSPMSRSTATATRQQQQRNKFTADVIRAIEELEFRRINRSSQQLAGAAWEKLQYDLPVVHLPELQALLESLRSSLQGKTSWPCYLLTSKALENITSGAKRSATFEPVLPDHEQKLQQILDDAITSTLHSKAGRASSSDSSSCSSTRQLQQQQVHPQAQQQQQQQQQAELPSAQQLYQQLCAVLLLQYAAKVASLPEHEAWQLLLEYWPEQHDKQDAPLPVEPQQQQGQHTDQQGLDASDDSEALAALAAAGVTSSTSSSSAAQSALHVQDSTQTASTSIYEVHEATVQDNDGEQYEDIAPVPASAAGSNSSSSRQYSPGGSTAAAVQPSQQYSWPVLRHKLNSIAEHVHYSVLAYEPLWQQHQAAQHLLQLLRALGVHNQAEQLQPMLHSYVGLLVDHLTAAPADLPLLQQLWQALGLTSGCGFGHMSTKPRQQVLPSEAVLGFSVAASVWSQLRGASARAKLWKLMYDNLLPLLEQCLEQLTYNMAATSSAKQANGVATGAAQPPQQQQQAVLGEGFAHMLLLSHIVELLVLGRQGAVDVAAQLTQRGATRSMVLLFGQHAGDAAAEPLRRAVLLAACSSQQAASWVLAVPAVLQQLQQPAFQLQGSAEAHGAVWELLLLSRSSSSGQATCRSGSEQQCLQLHALLTLSPAGLTDLQRQVVVLQLLVDVQKAAGRQQLWGQEVQQLLKQLASNMKEPQAAAAAQTASAATDACVVQSASAAGSAVEVESSHGLSSDAAAAQQVNGAESSGSSQSCGDDEGKGAKAARRLRQQLQQQGSVLDVSDARDAAADLGHRQSRQLQPAALNLIKQLLTSGGKTD